MIVCGIYMFNVFPPETSRLLELLEFYSLTSVPLLGIKNNASLMAIFNGSQFCYEVDD